MNFRLYRGNVVIRVAAGTKLDAAARNLVVIWIPTCAPDGASRWSGHARRITDVEEVVELSGTFLQPWVEGQRDHFVCILTQKVTGRRLRATETVASSGTDANMQMHP